MKKIVALILTAALLMTGVCLADSCFTCLRCGYYSWIGDNFCENCGARRPFGVFDCPICLADLGYSLDSSCPECGFLFGDAFYADEKAYDASAATGNSASQFAHSSDYDTWNCPTCNYELYSDENNINVYNFCPRCGYKVRLDASAAAGNSASQSVNSSDNDSWTCPGCGNICTVGKFCNECGTKKPENSWTCPNCGNVMDKGTFCSECGTQKPDGNASAADSDPGILALEPAKSTTSSEYGTLTVDSGTNIRGSAATNGSLVMTTNRQMTFKYVSCENGWYKIILDDGSYAYVYYTRATVTERAAGDDGSYGIKPTSGGSKKSGGGSSRHDASCDDPDISKHKLFYQGQKKEIYTYDLFDNPFQHAIITYDYYSCSCGKNTSKERTSKVDESCHFVWNKSHEYHICSKCGHRLLDEGWN